MWRWSTQQHHALALADGHRASRSGFEVLKICQERTNSIKGSLIGFPHEEDRRFSLRLCCMTEKGSEYQCGRWFVGPGWNAGQWEAAVAAGHQKQENVSTGCEAGRGEKVLIYQWQKTRLEKTPATCNTATFIL